MSDLFHDEPVKLRSLKQLKRHYHKLEKANKEGKDGFFHEFHSLQLKLSEVDDLSEVFVRSLLPQNKPKNRFPNVLPYDKTRVQLPEIPGVPGSDYINANYIDGDPMLPRSKNCYVASQGPLPSTVLDFWRMVWNEMSSMIVMLTKVVENVHRKDKKFAVQKCDQYWPKEGCQQIGEMFLISTYSPPLLDTPELTLTKLRVDYLPNGAARDVFHLQYREWADFGIPQDTEKFCQMIDLVDYYETFMTPTVVHCSAGVGRTGTFCTVHNNISRMKHFHSIGGNINKMDLFDVQGTVAKLRKERIGMVQTEDQYSFCYRAILDGAATFQESSQEMILGENQGFIPISREGLGLINQINQVEVSLPLDYEEKKEFHQASRMWQHPYFVQRVNPKKKQVKHQERRKDDKKKRRKVMID